MKLVFVSNYINHHQTALCEELNRLAGGSFAFIETEEMSEERLAMGWDSKAGELSYVVKGYAYPYEMRDLIRDADCVIFGGAEDEELIVPRLEAGKFTIRYSERLYKEGRWKFITPKGLMKKYRDHIRFRKNDAYLLCAGAYVAGDYRLIGAYPKKKFKFGYFPAVYEYADVHEKRRDNDKLNILWAARFIDWKHPEVMVFLARELKKAGIPFNITMIGEGDLFKKTRGFAKHLDVSDKITFTGAKTPEEVRERMLSSDIFVVTSDRLEGWGAVVNEAMNSGAVVMAPKQIGAAPYLINNTVNGFLYNATDYRQLFDIIDGLYKDKDKMLEIGNNAYETMVNTWNAKVAAQRLWDFIEDPAHEIKDYKDGPMSRA